MQGKVYLWKQVSSNIPNLVDSPLPSRLSISRRHPFYNVSHVVLLPTLSPRGTRNSDPEEANPRPHSFLPPPGFFPGLSARQLSCPSKMETPPSPSTEEIEFNSNFCTRWHFSRDCSPSSHISTCLVPFHVVDLYACQPILMPGPGRIERLNLAVVIIPCFTN